MDFPSELQARLDRLKITWGWSALLIAPICFGFGIYGFVEAWRGPWTAYWEENYVYQQSQCTILERKLSFLETSDGRASRPELLIDYQWDGKNHRIWTYRRDTLLGDAYIRPEPSDEGPGVTPEQAQARAQNVLERYPIGSVQPCWVNKNDPSKAILKKWRYIALGFTLPAIAVLAMVSGGLTLWNLCEKLLDRRRLLKRFEDNPEGWNCGTVYPHRLALDEESRGHRLLTVWGVMLWTVFSLIAVLSFWERKLYLGLLIAVPFAWMGLGACVISCWNFLFNRTGPTEVEMDSQPFIADQNGRGLVVQNVPLNVDQYKIAVRCRELTTFTEGTDTRIDSKEVYRQDLHDESILSALSWEPYRCDFNLAMPEGIPVSFKSEHNEIRWEIVVEGFRRGKSIFERVFPFEVRSAELS